MRTFLTIVLPLIAPTIVFLIWSWFAKKRAEAEARHQPIPAWQTWPWARLMLAGAVLAGLTLSGVALFRDAPPGNTRYVPAHMEDGELVPGHYEPVEPSGEGSRTYHGYGTAPPSLPNTGGEKE